MTARGNGLLAALVIGACAACSSGPPVDTAADGRAPASGTDPAGSSVEAGPLDLPGEEALTPPPPDPRAPGQMADLGDLPDGPLAGHLQLSLSGLVAFDEAVTGSCATMATGPALSVRLADGSVLRLAFDRERASSVLTAPGIEARHALDDVRTSVSGSEVEVEADLLTDGTTERSGTLVLTGRCG